MHKNGEYTRKGQVSVWQYFDLYFEEILGKYFT